MGLDIDSAIPEEWTQPLADTSAPQWMGAFTRLEVLIVVRGTSETTGCVCFEVAEDGRLQSVTVEAEIVRECCFRRIQVVGSLGKQWFVDPDPAAIVGEQA